MWNVFGVIKRKYSEVNKSKSTRLQNKETRLERLVYNIVQAIKISKRISTWPLLNKVYIIY